MKRAGFLVIVMLAVSGPACHAKGKSLGPLRVPGFVQANNGLGVAAAIRGGGFLERVALHFMGLDPPLVWVPPPKTADVIPAWMDEPVVMEARFTAIGVPACASPDYGRLAAALNAAPSASDVTPQGVIRFDAPQAPAAGNLDSREIYGHSADGCTLSARE